MIDLHGIQVMAVRERGFDRSIFEDKFFFFFNIYIYIYLEGGGVCRFTTIATDLRLSGNFIVSSPSFLAETTF